MQGRVTQLKEREARGRVDLDCFGKDTGQILREEDTEPWGGRTAGKTSAGLKDMSELHC